MISVCSPRWPTSRTPTTWMAHPPAGDLGRAGWQQLGLSFHRHQADPAVAHDGERRIPAQRGDVGDSGGPGGVEDRLVGLSSDCAAVDGEGGDHKLKLTRAPRSATISACRTEPYGVSRSAKGRRWTGPSFT